ncbi:hypothetical protein HPB50_019810 [Hyalomma asiaticum]|uniref:Uncharacterized protein n=1 Tax=Hyalomma asiaticum TaxID=266040 RepID=A0ACB7RY28_HYAAI|nr:hypothetical protein HPB50_019810 [Hyalomma asiaticum]
MLSESGYSRGKAQCSPGILDEQEVLPGRGSEVPDASVRASGWIKGHRAVSSRTQRCSRLGRGPLVPNYRTRAVPGGATVEARNADC